MTTVLVSGFFVAVAAWGGMMFGWCLGHEEGRSEERERIAREIRKMERAGVAK